MVTKTTYLLAMVAVVAILAFAVSPMATTFAESSVQPTVSSSEDMTYGEGEGKSCPGKEKSEELTA